MDNDKREIINEISEILNGHLFHSGLYFIKNKKLSNLEILNFVELFSSLRLNTYPYIQFIDLNKIDEEFYNNFNKKKS